MRARGAFGFLPVLVLFACKGPIYGPDRKPLMTGEEIRVLTAGISQTQFSDLPVPTSFELQRRNLESFGTQVGTFRLGRLLYFGTLAPEAVEQYLAQRLPEHGWKQSGREAGPDGDLALFYTKGPSTATYRISTVRGAKPGSYGLNSPTNMDVFTKLLIDLRTGQGG